MPGESTQDGCDETWGRRSGSGFLQAITHTLVSVELRTDMRRSRVRQSRRVILKASITSVILLSIAFIITYSVILTYISNKVPLMRRHDESASGKSKSGKRVKLMHRPYDMLSGDTVLEFMKDKMVKWNIEKLENSFSEKPECHKETKTMVLITSAPNNSEKRRSIRETWCRPSNFNLVDHPWQCVFLLGQTLEKSSQLIIENEISHHHDILQGSYVDSYRNLTIKIMHGLRWSSTDCPTDYVLKTDDDVYVNTQLLHSLILSNTPRENVYIGSVVDSRERLQVIRNQLNKWAVTYEEYPLSYYPPYAVGMGYILSMDVVKNMVNISGYVVPFANEDAYIGVLAYRLGLEPTTTGRFVLTGSGLRTCNMRYLVVVHYVTAQGQSDMFQMNQDASTQCSDETDGVLTWS